MGLGLTISKMIVRQLGGEVYVTSEPGQGSKFSFSIPLENESIMLPQQCFTPTLLDLDNDGKKEAESEDERLAEARLVLMRTHPKIDVPEKDQRGERSCKNNKAKKSNDDLFDVDSFKKQMSRKKVIESKDDLTSSYVEYVSDDDDSHQNFRVNYHALTSIRSEVKGMHRGLDTQIQAEQSKEDNEPLIALVNQSDGSIFDRHEEIVLNDEEVTHSHEELLGTV